MLFYLPISEIMENETISILGRIHWKNNVGLNISV